MAVNGQALTEYIGQRRVPRRGGQRGGPRVERTTALLVQRPTAHHENGQPTVGRHGVVHDCCGIVT
jgi:hypothetical protein